MQTINTCWPEAVGWNIRFIIRQRGNMRGVGLGMNLMGRGVNMKSPVDGLEIEKVGLIVILVNIREEKVGAGGGVRIGMDPTLMSVRFFELLLLMANMKMVC